MSPCTPAPRRVQTLALSLLLLAPLAHATPPNPVAEAALASDSGEKPPVTADPSAPAPSTAATTATTPLATGTAATAATATTTTPTAATPTAAAAAQAASTAPARPGGLSRSLAQPLESPLIMRGNDQVLAPSLATLPASGSSASLRFENTAIGDVAHVVLREMARVDYVVHPPLAGTVTLSTAGPVTVDQALYLLESALQANGLLMVRDPRGTYHIGRAEALRNIVPGVRQAGNGPLPPGNGAVVVQLQYIGAAEMATILRPLLPPEALIRVDPLRNLLVLAGTRTQAEGWLDLVRTFDVNMLQGMSVGVFPLRHISTRDVEAAMRLISGNAGAAPAPAATTTAAGATPASATVPIPASAGLGSLRILPLERLSSVIVVANRASQLDEARLWIEKLDQPGMGGGADAQLFVYPVQNGNAAHLASVLNGLFGSTGGPAAAPADSGTAPGLRTASASGAGSNQLDRAAGTRAGTADTVTTMALASGLRIIADNINNAILVYGGQHEFRKIEAALKRLDTSAAQVLIEASIVEVTLNDDMQYGLQWNFTEQRGSNTGFGQLLNGTGLGALANGFSYTLSNSTGQVRAVLKALADKSLVRVISSPSLMVLDNHTASISVGNQQPVLTSTTVTDGGNTTTAIQYKDTGVSLSVTPQVNAGNMVAMVLNQSVTDVGGIDVATGQRAFLQRQVASKVAVRSGESIVLGGLIRDNDTTGKSGLPVLKDVPLFGALFGTHNRNNARTELLVIITPRVLRNDDELRDAGAELRDRMKRIQAFQDEQQRHAAPAPAAVPAAALAH